MSQRINEAKDARVNIRINSHRARAKVKSVVGDRLQQHSDATKPGVGYLSVLSWHSVPAEDFDRIKHIKGVTRMRDQALREPGVREILAMSEAWLVEAGVDSSEVDALFNNMTLMQYCVHSMFKKQQIPAIAKRVAKKFDGTENMFLGPGTIRIDPKTLEAALWKYVGNEVVSGLKHVKPEKEHYAIGGVMFRFYIDEKHRKKVKDAAISILGRDVFVNDDNK